MGVPSSPPTYGMPPPPNMMPPPPELRAKEVGGVKMARLAAILSLLGLALTLLAPLGILAAAGTHLPLIGISFGTASWTIGLLEEFVAIILVGTLVSFLGYIFYMVSFNSLRKVHTGFGAPFALTIVGIIGILLVMLGVGIVLGTIVAAVGCAASGAASSCVSFSDLFGGVIAVLLGLLLAFIGWIGLLIGIYRIGSRYNSGITKVGAILYIIPLVNIIAPILVLVGIQGIVKRLEAEPAMAAPPMMAPPMPPPS